MLHQELPSIESTPLDGWGRWLAPALAAAAGLTAAVMLLIFGQRLLAVLALINRIRICASTDWLIDWTIHRPFPE